VSAGSSPAISGVSHLQSARRARSRSAAIRPTYRHASTTEGPGLARPPGTARRPTSGRLEPRDVGDRAPLTSAPSALDRVRTTAACFSPPAPTKDEQADKRKARGSLAKSHQHHHEPIEAPVRTARAVCRRIAALRRAQSPQHPATVHRNRREEVEACKQEVGPQRRLAIAPGEPVPAATSPRRLSRPTRGRIQASATPGEGAGRLAMASSSGRRARQTGDLRHSSIGQQERCHVPQSPCGRATKLLGQLVDHDAGRRGRDTIRDRDEQSCAVRLPAGRQDSPIPPDSGKPQWRRIGTPLMPRFEVTGPSTLRFCLLSSR